MLVLSRRVRESLIIGDDVKVTMVEVVGGQVKIGICASKEVAVYRQENHQRIKVNERKAS